MNSRNNSLAHQDPIFDKIQRLKYSLVLACNFENVLELAAKLVLPFSVETTLKALNRN